jgi:hypothetical protein
VLLAEYDTAAWNATDAVKAVHPVGGWIGRYVGRKTDAGWVVDFGKINQARDKFLVAYEAVSVSAKFEVKRRVAQPLNSLPSAKQWVPRPSRSLRRTGVGNAGARFVGLRGVSTNRGRMQYRDP